MQFTLIFHLFRNASLTFKRQYLCQYRAEVSETKFENFYEHKKLLIQKLFLIYQGLLKIADQKPVVKIKLKNCLCLICLT